jgi:branched-chain amino acid transport system ATP-binding protein
MSVKENLELGAYPRRARRGLHEGLERAFKLFPVLKTRADALAGTLSGGEQQMLATARGLMAHPKLLLLDEPFLGLAPQPAARLEEAIRGLREEGVTILMAGQHLKRLLTLADRACLLQGGRVILEGGREVLLQSDLVRRALSS